jgi:uncharacterized protein
MSDRVETIDDLRNIYRMPSDGAVKKELSYVDKHCRRFIELSPFLCMGTVNANGSADVSPRGGMPGFVHVLDEKLLAIPDRPGNNRLDSFVNILSQPAVGLVFFVPGFEEVVRVNGIARISVDPDLIARFPVEGKLPRSVLLIEVKEALLHCAKAIHRAGLWNPANHIDRSTFPSAGQIFRDQLSLEKEASAIDDVLAKDLRDTLY